MKRYWILFALATMVFMTGCATQQTPSVYSHTQGSQMNAQDEAEKYLAAVNVTYNCATCTDVQKEHILRALSRNYVQDTDKNWYQKTVVNDMGETVNWRLNRALDQALFLILQDY